LPAQRIERLGKPSVPVLRATFALCEAGEGVIFGAGVSNITAIIANRCACLLTGI
jgi:hypothetical protein